MRRVFSSLPRIACFAACGIWGAGSFEAEPLFVVTPGKSFGPVREATSRTHLSSIFGAASVEDGELVLPDGACVTGTIVYSATNNAIEIGWGDPEQTHVAFVRTRLGSVGPWTTPRGVRVGTTLRRLIRLSGKPVRFLGFGDDHSGQMIWSEKGQPLQLELRSEMDKLPEKAYGSAWIQSDVPGLDPGKVTVARLQQVWHAVWESHDCHG